MCPQCGQVAAASVTTCPECTAALMEVQFSDSIELPKISLIGQTKFARVLYIALKQRGINSITEYFDGHKRIDVAIPDANLYIEVDGIQHLNDPQQMLRDFKRDYYSNSDGFFTLHVHNDDLKNHLNSIADAITEVVRRNRPH
jgi:very-short-patch-repair endonuclease